MSRLRMPTVIVAGAACLALAVGQSGSGGAAPQDKARWDEKYAGKEYLFGKEPVPFLKAHVGLLPKGRALDLATGEGRNVVFLATQGFQVVGVDISEKGLAKARALAAEHGATIETQVADLETWQPPANAFEVVVCTYYLQRDLFPRIKAALKPGGVAVVETYTLDHLKYRPKFPKAFLLQPDELKELFEGFEILAYQVTDDGHAAFASIVARKKG